MALASLLSFAFAACGEDKTDVSGGVEDINRQITDGGRAATLECPKEVDGGEGATFECTLKATEGDASEKVQMQIQKQGDDLVVGAKDQKAFDQAVDSVAPQEGQ